MDAPAPPASTATYPAIPPRQLPPIGYQAQGVSSVPHYAQPSSGIDTMQPYAPAGPLYPPYNGTPYNHSQGSTIYTPPRQQPSQANAGEVDADAEPDPDVPSGGYAQ